MRRKFSTASGAAARKKNLPRTGWAIVYYVFAAHPVFAALIVAMATFAGCQSCGNSPPPRPGAASEPAPSRHRLDSAPAGSHHVRRGNEYLNVGYFQAAKMEFEKALHLDPLDREAHCGYYKAGLFAALENGHAGYHQSREREIEEFLADHEKDAHVQIYLGKKWHALHDTAKALAHLNKALALNSGLPLAYYAKAEIYASQNKSSAALPLYEKAWQLCSQNGARANPQPDPPACPPVSEQDRGAGAWYVQLLTSPLRESAYSFKQGFQKNHQSLLNSPPLHGKNLQLVPVKPGQYDVQLGPFANENAALNASRELEARSVPSRLINRQ